jgi:hypothetical protein
MAEIPEDIRAKAEALCAFLEAMPSEGNISAIARAIAPKGYVLAPVLATEAMELAGLREMSIDHNWAQPVWNAMLSASRIRTP